MAPGDKALISVCADGVQGTVAMLERGYRLLLGTVRPSPRARTNPDEAAK
jgi:hypothetical protein